MKKGIERFFLKYKSKIDYKTGILLVKVGIYGKSVNHVYLNEFRDECDVSMLDIEQTQHLIFLYLNHYFDLLGSGWIKVGYVNNALGINKRRYESIELETDTNGDFLNLLLKKEHAKKSKKVWNMIEGDYVGIDWQRDFKSGWRWKNSLFYYPRIWPEMGADLKVPWELSRLQHLPRMYFLALKSPKDRALLFNEFYNQILDFIALNPIGYGVNYMCTMDVAIRVANMVLAWTLWEKDIKENKEYKTFSCIYFDYIYKQCVFIYRNLEWRPTMSMNGGNHYMADLVGLIWGTSVLKNNLNVIKWRNFAICEFKKEIRLQFYKDGANREGSAGYHRLTLEMAVYTTALLLYKGVFIEQEIFDILANAGMYLAAITRPDHNFSQIGDNDSGRLFRLSFDGVIYNNEEIKKLYTSLSGYESRGFTRYFDENVNGTGSVLKAVSRLLDIDYDSMSYNAGEKFEIESYVIGNLVEKKFKAKCTMRSFLREDFTMELPYLRKEKFFFGSPIKISGLKLYEFPDVGVIIIKSSELYVMFNLTEVPKNGKISHTHNDKLSIEVCTKDKVLVEDGGTFLYTALPEEQLIDKSVNNHLGFSIGGEEQDRIHKDGKWYVKNNETECHLIKASPDEIIAYIKYRDIIHLRKMMVFEDRIELNDYANRPFKEAGCKRRVTKGYGKLVF